MQSFSEKITRAQQKANSLVCVGIDPVVEKLPSPVTPAVGGFFEFAKAIIDETADLVCAYKPNSAFFEAHGEVGIVQLKKICDYISGQTEVPIILDAKRGDIGNTNEGYAQFAFEYLGVDAITVHPYQGLGALAPFLKHTGRGIIVLCHTSNPEAQQFQEMIVDGKPLYMHVAKECFNMYKTNSNVAIVAGATYPEEMSNLRLAIGDMNMLVPGIGAQGGAVDAIKNGLTEAGRGVIVNASRSVLYASAKQDFAQAARSETQKLQNLINSLR